MRIGFHHVHVKGPDPRKTAQWYVDVFGARVKDQMVRGGAPFISLELGGVLINVSGAEDGEKLPRGVAERHFGLEHFGLSVDSIDELMPVFRRLGVDILHAPPPGQNGARAVFIRAPDDVRIEVYQPPRADQ